MIMKLCMVNGDKRVLIQNSLWKGVFLVMNIPTIPKLYFFSSWTVSDFFSFGFHGRQIM